MDVQDLKIENCVSYCEDVDVQNINSKGGISFLRKVVVVHVLNVECDMSFGCVGPDLKGGISNIIRVWLCRT